ncbi:hypothetical protein C7212DRAFT_317676 [Tuber magnatum]|uniref:Uncharacterized protein n=1 Tax=Tuber magnatum TaxID=42249 RepID=A0A317SPN0_9PEZI|nr:hypothetical protein C7212DRAFT_317676 [Tuber magnatum]
MRQSQTAQAANHYSNNSNRMAEKMGIQSRAQDNLRINPTQDPTHPCHRPKGVNIQWLGSQAVERG